MTFGALFRRIRIIARYRTVALSEPCFCRVSTFALLKDGKELFVSKAPMIGALVVQQ